MSAPTPYTAPDGHMVIETDMAVSPPDGWEWTDTYLAEIRPARTETVPWWQAVGRVRDTGTYIAKAENDRGVISLYSRDGRHVIGWSERHVGIPTVDVLVEDGVS